MQKFFIITLENSDTGYPVGFNKSVIIDFKMKDKNQPITPEWLFDKRSKVLFKLPYRPSNKHDVKKFINRIESFIKIMLIFLQLTRNIESFSDLKTKLCIYLVWFMKSNVLVT